jgi:3-methyladenine DNA glycosylase AlkC
MIIKIQDIKTLLAEARANPGKAFPAIKSLAASDQWQTREVAATALVEIGKRHPAAVLRQARVWAKDRDSNVRRAASEGLRGMVKINPDLVRPILEVLRADPELYVKKSVANVLRNASGKHAEFVLGLCREWGRSRDANTRWIVKDGLRKLKASRPHDVEIILEASDARVS